MGVFETLPYTNFQDLNLDWILAKVMEYGSLVEEFKTSLDDAIVLFNQLKTSVLSLQETVTDIESDINTINNNINTINSTISGLRTELNSLYDQYNTLFDTVNEILINMGAIEAKVDNIEVTIEAIAERVLLEYIESGRLRLNLAENYDAENKALTLYIEGGGN